MAGALHTHVAKSPFHALPQADAGRPERAEGRRRGQRLCPAALTPGRTCRVSVDYQTMSNAIAAPLEPTDRSPKFLFAGDCTGERRGEESWPKAPPKEDTLERNVNDLRVGFLNAHSLGENTFRQYLLNQHRWKFRCFCDRREVVSRYRS